MRVEQYDEIVEMTRDGATNEEICKKLDIKLPTLQSWKKKIRANGDILNMPQGRPKQNFIKYSERHANDNEMKKSDS